MGEQRPAYGDYFLPYVAANGKGEVRRGTAK